MAKIQYREWKPGRIALQLIDTAEAIASDYASQGYDLTLRQLYYQFVARGIIPNKQAEYSRLGDVLNKARMAGLFDWDYIVDRTRNLQSLSHWATPADVIDSAAQGYRNNLWRDQPNRVEVWVEKEALAGVIGQVADRHDVAYFACRGYVSASELWGAAQRLGRYMRAGQRVTVLHLGDHDPSGIDMTRDIEDRLRLITSQDNYNRGRLFNAAGLRVNRIALNMDQVEQYDPPPNPAKLTDSRSDGYIAEHGDSSWELDALDPAVLDALVESHILALRDDERWARDLAAQEHDRVALNAVSANWSDVEDYALGLA